MPSGPPGDICIELRERSRDRSPSARFESLTDAPPGRYTALVHAVRGGPAAGGAVLRGGGQLQRGHGRSLSLRARRVRTARRLHRRVDVLRELAVLIRRGG